jgi:large subunit ribosomal protein L29
MATAAEIVELDIDELEVRLNETRRELFNLRFQLATGQLDNFSRMNHVRKDIARLLTEIRAREIAEAEGLAVEDIPVHQAAARQAAEDKALGRTRVPAAERRAAERAEEDEGAEADEDAEVEDSDEAEDVIEAEAEVRDEAEAEDDVDTAGTAPASAAAGGATDKDVKEEG